MEILQLEIGPKPTPTSNYILQFAQISLFSGLGVILRLLSSSNSRTLLPAVVYPQMIGCFIMGMITKSDPLSRYPYLRLGLSTGLCGSITSFSTFALQTGKYLISGEVWNGFIMIILTMSLSCTSFIIGQRIPFLKSRKENDSLYLSFLNDSVSIRIISLVVQVSTICWCIFDVANRSISAAALLGPLGSFVRFGLAKYNKISYAMPYGTLIANCFATGLLSLISALNSSSITDSYCIILFAISNGFCGSLSTFSTFIVEIYEMEPNGDLKYISITIILGIFLCCTIYGIPIWIGKDSAVCLVS